MIGSSRKKTVCTGCVGCLLVRWSCLKINKITFILRLVTWPCCHWWGYKSERTSTSGQLDLCWVSLKVKLATSICIPVLCANVPLYNDNRYFAMFATSTLLSEHARDAKLHLLGRTTSHTTAEPASFARRENDLLLRSLVVVHRNVNALPMHSGVRKH